MKNLSIILSIIAIVIAISSLFFTSKNQDHYSVDNKHVIESMALTPEWLLYTDSIKAKSIQSIVLLLKSEDLRLSEHNKLVFTAYFKGSNTKYSFDIGTDYILNNYQTKNISDIGFYCNNIVFSLHNMQPEGLNTCFTLNIENRKNTSIVIDYIEIFKSKVKSDSVPGVIKTDTTYSNIIK